MAKKKVQTKKQKVIIALIAFGNLKPSHEVAQLHPDREVHDALCLAVRYQLLTMVGELQLSGEEKEALKEENKKTLEELSSPDYTLKANHLDVLASNEKNTEAIQRVETWLQNWVQANGNKPWEYRYQAYKLLIEFIKNALMAYQEIFKTTLDEQVKGIKNSEKLAIRRVLANSEYIMKNHPDWIKNMGFLFEKPFQIRKPKKRTRGSTQFSC